MELRQLRYFLGVAECRSFSAAAASLHIAQPAISRSIKHLEEELGVFLFTRHGKGVFLTDAGSRFKTRAEIILRQLEQSIFEVKHELEEPVGHVTFGVPPSLERLVAVPALSSFRNQYQNVLLHIFEGLSDTLRAQIICGELDLAVITSVQSICGLAISPFVTESLYVIGPKDGSILSGDTIPASTLLSLPLIVATRPNGSRSTIEQHFGMKNKQPNIVMDAMSLSMILALVSEKHGYTILPGSAAHFIPAWYPVVMAPIEGLKISWKIASSKDRPLGLAAQKLRESLIKTANDLIDNQKWPNAVLDAA